MMPPQDKPRRYTGWYYLDANDVPTPVETDDQLRAVYEDKRRFLKRGTIGESQVSTVFLGLDHSMGSERPMLYETMVFGGKHDQECERYGTRDEALWGHNAVIERIARSAFGEEWYAAYQAARNEVTA